MNYGSQQSILLANQDNPGLQMPHPISILQPILKGVGGMGV